ncbi:Pre-mRNA-splicing factor CLF1 [Trametes pubescens]|uniref:Pre-mRNA-splicing factor CLF1 n=1 Tax=Trametes pubescens TaxID=154538 RepID=A0A1M2V8N2_TRAPU|nr:Pre-mRNA-splicing factor CLF1 [Trametes pubescens]
MAQAVFNAFTKIETRLKEYGRARVIYKRSFLTTAATTEEGALLDLREEGSTGEEEEPAANQVHEAYKHTVAQDYGRALQIYETAIRLVPYKQFTFAELWTTYARFEVRQLKLPVARKILGTAIGVCLQEVLFKGYIQLDCVLREFDRVRTLYEKYLEWDPSNSAARIKYAELETQLQNFACVRAIFEVSVAQSALSMPELLWKAYIDFETEEGEREHCMSACVVLLEIWKVFEEKYGMAEDVVKVQGMMPITSK